MARKPFRLEAVLSHKKRLEEAMQVRLARLREEHTHQRAYLDQIRQHQAQQEEALAARQAGLLDAEEVQQRILYIDRVIEKERAQGRVVEDLAGEVDEKREHLVLLLKEKKVLERLKELERQRAELAARRLEAREIDELTMARFVRRQRKEAS